MKIYVVIGSVGEYSDRTEWLAMAFFHESDAKDYVLKCEENGRILMHDYNQDEECLYDWYWYLEDEKAPDKYTAIDPYIRPPQYTGYRYWYEGVEYYD